MIQRHFPVPKLHKSTGQAYVRYEGKCKYFGKFGTEKADKSYWRWRGEIGGKSAAYCTVLELLNRYENDKKSLLTRCYVSRLKNLKDGLGSLANLEVDQFGPLSFRQFRAQIASTGTRCARQVNDLMRYYQLVVKWCVSMQLVSIETYQTLKTVLPLKNFEVEHQAIPRKPAVRRDVEKTFAELSPFCQTIVKLISLTGARPGEICSMRASDIDKHGPHNTWVYRPKKHKSVRFGKRRQIPLGIEAKRILALVWPIHGDFFFPSTMLIGQNYTETALRQAVGHAAKRAGVVHWTPYQLRHLFLTNLAADHGIELAAQFAGHSQLSTTQLYTHLPDAEQTRQANSVPSTILAVPVVTRLREDMVGA